MTNLDWFVNQCIHGSIFYLIYGRPHLKKCVIIIMIVFVNDIAKWTEISLWFWNVDSTYVVYMCPVYDQWRRYFHRRICNTVNCNFGPNTATVPAGHLTHETLCRTQTTSRFHSSLVYPLSISLQSQDSSSFLMHVEVILIQICLFLIKIKICLRISEIERNGLSCTHIIISIYIIIFNYPMI